MSQRFTVSPCTSPTATNKFLCLLVCFYSSLWLTHYFCWLTISVIHEIHGPFMAQLPMVFLPLFSKVCVVVVVSNRNCDLSNLIPIVLVEQSSCSMILELTACPWSVYI